jgi:DHA1 family multidrug resistance protein-like MFS transporter
METGEKKTPLLSPIMRWFMLAMVLANIAGSMAPLLMPIYLTEQGASVGQVGMVFTITSMVILVLQIIGGWVSDSIGRLRAIAIGSVGGIIGFVALIIAPTWQWMIVALAIYQIPFALVGPSFNAFIAENSTEDNRGKVYGITGTIYQVTGVVGPPLGGLIAGSYGFKPMLLVAGILYSAAAGLRIWMATTMRSPEEKQSRPMSMKSFKSGMTTVFAMLFGGGIITWIFITDGVNDIANQLTNNLQPLYLQQVAGITVEQIGLLGAIFSIAMMTVPMVSGRLSDRYGERVPIFFGFLTIFVALWVFLSSRHFIGFAVVWAIFGLGVGLLGPAYQALISKVVPAKMLGTFSGIFYSSVGFISLAAPWLGAKMWENWGPRSPFFATAIASALVLPIIWVKFKLPQKSEAALEESSAA